jgi:hypothetical protein
MFTAADAAYAIRDTVRQYAGLFEVKPNQEWSDPVKSKQLIARLKGVGWQLGWPYCMALVEAVVTEAYQLVGASPGMVALISRKFNPHVMTSWRNCFPMSQSQQALDGSVFFMRSGSTDSGHAGIVTFGTNYMFQSIEGNTSDAPISGAADREGDGIYCKQRAIDFRPKSGLHLKGFLNPMDYSTLEALALKGS